MKNEVFENLLKEIENMPDNQLSEMIKDSLTRCKHMGFDFDTCCGYCDKGHMMFDSCNEKECSDFEKVVYE